MPPQETDALATFALGRFIDYRMEEGLAADMLAEFMQAYLDRVSHANGVATVPLAEVLRGTHFFHPAAQQAQMAWRFLRDRATAQDALNLLERRFPEGVVLPSSAPPPG